jgi:hypothetical protein
VPPSCRLISRVVPVLVPRAGTAAQALSRSCFVPALALWCRARAVLFRAVSVLTHRAWPIWPSIITNQNQMCETTLLPFCLRFDFCAFLTRQPEFGTSVCSTKFSLLFEFLQRFLSSDSRQQAISLIRFEAAYLRSR